MASLICPKCKGDGFYKMTWEADEEVFQCDVCNSQGELIEGKHYNQSWEEPAFGGKKSRTFYFGPFLTNYDSFKNYQIHKS